MVRGRRVGGVGITARRRGSRRVVRKKKGDAIVVVRGEVGGGGGCGFQLRVKRKTKVLRSGVEICAKIFRFTSGITRVELILACG